jgi:hypothetical protein
MIWFDADGVLRNVMGAFNGWRDGLPEYDSKCQNGKGIMENFQDLDNFHALREALPYDSMELFFRKCKIHGNVGILTSQHIHTLLNLGIWLWEKLNAKPVLVGSRIEAVSVLRDFRNLTPVAVRPTMEKIDFIDPDKDILIDDHPNLVNNPLVIGVKRSYNCNIIKQDGFLDALDDTASAGILAEKACNAWGAL